MLTLAPLAHSPRCTTRPMPRQRQRVPFPTVFARPAAANTTRRTPPQLAEARHDFLVPNPRPDLTADGHLCRMLERA